ncbi:MAG: zinc-binding alcohol dehydrogenase family protein [Caldilineaceae bacterium]|nr:zinc-binding alcohol dehydrogenase family protein [Caldilineaceae bacterium]
MKQITLTEPFCLRQEDVSVPERKAGEVLVRVRRIGICGTDLHAYRGRQPFFTYPRVLGHELAVEVVDPGTCGSCRSGDHRVVLPYLACGSCSTCRRGRSNCCVRMQVLGVHADGGMREALSLPPDLLLPADGLSLSQMALVENQCIGAHAVQRAAIHGRDTVVVVGTGPIGLGVVQFACMAGPARVIVADIAQDKLDFCSEHFQGVTDVCLVDEDFEARLADLTNGEMAHVLFDATGHPGSMERGFDLVAHGGTYVLVSLVQADITFHDPDFHRREVTLKSSRNATRQDFERVISAMQKNVLVTDPLLTHEVPFDDVTASFGGWLDPEAGVIKAMAHL